MNKSNIEWCDYTWNPATGCRHGCSYCYARRIAARGLGRYGDTGFTPTFHYDRIDYPSCLAKPSRVFVGSMADLLGDWKWQIYGEPANVEASWLEGKTIAGIVANAMCKAPQHRYLVLTKANLFDPTVLEKAQILAAAGAWIGASFTEGDVSHRFLAFLQAPLPRKFISFEPLKNGMRLFDSLVFAMAKQNIRWVIIGGMTGAQRKKYAPEQFQQSIHQFFRQARKAGIAVFLKDNLNYPQIIREFPADLILEG